MGLVNNFGAIKGVTAILARFSSEILPPQVAGDFKGNEYHADLEKIRTEQIPLQRKYDKATSKVRMILLIKKDTQAIIIRNIIIYKNEKRSQFCLVIRKI